MEGVEKVDEGDESMTTTPKNERLEPENGPLKREIPNLEFPSCSGLQPFILGGVSPSFNLGKGVNPIFIFFLTDNSGQIIATSHDRFPRNGGLVREIP